MSPHIVTRAAVAALVAAACASGAHAGTFTTLSVHDLASFGVDSYQITLGRGDVFSAMATPLRNQFIRPDTILGLFDADDNLIVSNDDGLTSNTTHSYGSALYYRSAVGGSYTLRVTGYSDFGFIGAHGEHGRYAITTSVLPVARGVVDFGPGDLIPIVGFGSALGVGFLDDDVHEYTIALKTGDVLSAMTTPLDSGSDFDTPDTILGVFDPLGNLLVSNDDGPSGPVPSSRGSGVGLRVFEDGLYTIKVTGYPDFDFDGAHSEVGAYALTVSVIPTPGAWTLLGLAALVAVRRRRA